MADWDPPSSFRCHFRETKKYDNFTGFGFAEANLIMVWQTVFNEFFAEILGERKKRCVYSLHKALYEQTPGNWEILFKSFPK